MRRFLLALLCVSLFTIGAKADSFNFYVTGSAMGLSGSGVLTGNNNGNGSYTITSITGPAFLGPISVLAPNSSLFLNDNLFFPTSTLVDARGIAFSGAFGQADLFSIGSQYFVRGLDSDGDPFLAQLNLTLDRTSAVTPEPSSVLLTMTGMLGIGALAYSNRRRLFGASAAFQPLA